MIKHLQTKMLLLLGLLLAGVGTAWAQSKTKVSVTGTAITGTTASYSQTYNTPGQLTNGNSATLTIEDVPEDVTITGITLGVHNNKSAGNGDANATMNGTEFATLTGISGLGNSAFVDKDMTVTPTTGPGTLVITIKATTNSVYIETFKITYSISGSSVTKSDPAFSYGDVEEYTINLGETFQAPALAYADNFNGTISYESSNTAVATISDAGELTLGAEAGTTTITASFAGDDDWKSSSASYTLTVVDPNAPGTANNPYSVANAIAYINTLGSSTSPNKVYVKGVVSQVDS